VPREAPLSLIHLRNMVAATEAGAVVVPAAPGFYQKPETFEDLVLCVGDICRYWLSRNRTPYWVETTC